MKVYVSAMQLRDKNTQFSALEPVQESSNYTREMDKSPLSGRMPSIMNQDAPSVLDCSAASPEIKDLKQPATPKVVIMKQKDEDKNM